MHQWCLTFLIGIVHTVGSQSELEMINVALEGSITAKYSCGYFGDEVYYNHTEALWSAVDREPKTCTADLFPAQYMVDGALDTFWQSSSRSRLYADINLGTDELDAVIEIDLHQKFIVQQLILILGDSKRPNHMSLHKSVDGLNWSPIAYKVTVETECLDKFAVMLSSQPLNDDGYTCTSYGRPMSNKDEMIIFDLSQYPRPTWKTTRYLRFSFYQMHLTLGISGDKFQHYTVRELQVLAVCPCNDLATDCVYNNISTQYECQCGYNTHGEYCESCLPLFNQQPYQPGVPCQECECYGHAQTCEYNETVANISLSKDVYGGGVCINCSDFTTGMRCESCIDYYYRPMNVSQNHSTPCLPCDCFLAGVVLSSNTGLLGDCVSSSNELTLYNASQSMIPGDCHCKPNVGGAKCDQCLPSFYNLSSDNPLGCQGCQCTRAGTVDNTNICDVADGRCPCKAAVQGLQCEQCRDGYFGLSLFNPLGCHACMCTPGASLSPLCNKTSGQCDCKPSTNGRTCHRVTDGHYYPDMDSISVEPELFSESFDFFLPSSGLGYITVNNSWALELFFPAGPGGAVFAGVYDLYIKYTTDNAISSIATVAVHSQVEGGDVPLPPCTQIWCYSRLTKQPISAQTDDVVFFNLVTNGSLLLDSLIFVPHEFSTGQVGNVTIDVPQQCQLYSRSLEVPMSTDCEEYIYSISMLYYEQALPCNCNSTGSVSPVCTPRGGGCICRPGVGGRACDRCMSGYFNFTSQGCQACNCAGVDKLCDDATGKCTCSPTLEGMKCDQCIADHWKWSPTGCEECGCDIYGSKATQCNTLTGQCTCMPGVHGTTCDSCIPQFYNLTASGCTPCLCHVTGSIDNTCHNVTGQCSCKENVMGRSCDVCTPNSYFFTGDDRSGCISCDCMGVSSECNSYNQSIIEIWFDLGSATLTTLNSTHSLEGFTVESSRSIVVDSSSLYLRVISPGGDNLLKYYTSRIQVTYSPSPILVSDTVLSIYLRSYKNELTSFQISISAGVYSTLSLVAPLMETQWRNSTGHPLSRQAFLASLATTEGIYLPLSLGSGSIRISNLHLLPSELSPQLVEKCVCGMEYVGLSCETCAFGYTRQAMDNTSLGICTACNCNSLSNDCSITTGECTNCLNYTSGDSCQLCLPGYYGGIQHGYADGCRQCPCYYYGRESPLCDIINGTVTCNDCKLGYTGEFCDQCESSHWFNGTHCLPCECNGNTDACDYTTGQCVDCMYNSTGWYCDVCADGFYGDATTQSCAACGCDILGSLSSVCNQSTGQCLCKSHVVSHTCNQCQFGYWNISSAGCTPCGCQLSGSLSQQCDLLSGVCSCRENATGSQCELCSLGSFGLPQQPCQDCACDVTGSYNYTKPCDVISGQCECRDGVAGRRCDQCMDMFYGFSASGCTECGECETRLGAYAGRYITLVQEYSAFSEHLLRLIYQHKTLIELQVSVNQLSADSEVVGGIQNRTWILLSEAKEQMNYFLSNYTTLENRISDQLTTSHQLQNSILSAYNILLTAYQQSVEISMDLQNLRNLTNQSIEYKKSMYIDVCEEVVNWQSYWSIQNRSLDEQLFMASQLFTHLTNSTSLLASYLSRSAELMEDSLNTYNSAIFLQSQYNKLTSQMKQLNLSLSDLLLNLFNISETFNQTEMYYTFNEMVYNSTVTLVYRCSELYTTALTTYNSSELQLELILFQQQNLRNKITETESRLLTGSARVNESLKLLPELQLKAVYFSQAALNVTSLIASISRDNSPSIYLYTRYVNASYYIGQLLNQSLDTNTSLAAYEAALDADNLSQLAASVENSADAMRLLKVDDSWIDSTTEEIMALRDIYTDLSTVSNTTTIAISNASFALESLTAELVNNSALYTDIQHNIRVAENAGSEITAQLSRISATFTSFYNLADILYNTSISTNETTFLLNATAENMTQTLVDTTNIMVNLTSTEQSNSQRISGIEQRLAALEAALARTELWSREQKKSVAAGNQTTLYNVTVDGGGVLEVSLEFALSDHSDQMMLTITSANTLSQIILLFADGALKLSIYHRENVVQLTSRAYLFTKVWTRAIITCHKGNVSLVVTDLESSRTHVVDETSLSINGSLFSEQVQLSMGQQDVIADSRQQNWKPFGGCLQGLKVNSVELDLEGAAITSTCCPTPAQDSTLPAISLDGFGFAYIKGMSRSIQNLTLRFSLRTHSTAGDVVSFVSTDNSTRVALSLAGGRLKLQTSLSAAYTSHQYSKGLWVDVHCKSNHTNILCSVTVGDLVESLHASIPDGSRLFADQILISTEASNVDRFAGCLANLTINGYHVDPWLDLGRFKGVLPYCVDKVVRGVSFKADSSFSLHHNMSAEAFVNVTTEFVVTEPSGSLLSLSSADVTIEIGVVFSHIVAIAKVGKFNQQIELASVVLDSRFHNLSIELNGTSLLIGLDEEIQIKKFPLSNLTSAVENTSWFLQLGRYKTAALPVNKGFTGGIQSLQVNQWSVPLQATSIYITHQMASLSGISYSEPFPAELITPPPPTCSPPEELLYSSTGRRFGVESQSFALFDSLNISKTFNLSCSVTLWFRTFSPDGLLLYMPNDMQSPTQWMSLVLRNGCVHYSVQTSSMLSDTLVSRYTYTDGAWYTLTALRYYDFAALVVNGNDYTNNGRAQDDNSYLSIGPQVYVGGLAGQLKQISPSFIVTKSFDGCIDNITLSSLYSSEGITLNLTNPTVAEGTGLCYVKVEKGVTVLTDGFIHLVSGIDVDNDTDLEISVTAKSVDVTYPIVTVADAVSYITTYTNSTKVVVVLGSLDGKEEQIFSSDLKHTNVNLCDTSADIFNLTISRGNITLAIGNAIYQYTLDVHWQLVNADVFVGAVPDAVKLPSHNISSKEFAVCVDNMVVNGEILSSASFVSSSNTTVGCL